MKRLALALVILLVLVVAAYCVYRPVAPIPTPTTIAVGPTPTPTATPAPPKDGTITPSPNPAKDLLDIFKGWSSAKSFRAKMTTTGGAAGAQDMTLEVVMPDRFHVTMAQTMEAIIIGKDIYLRLGDRWQKTVTPQGLDLTIVDPKRYATQLTGTTAVKDVTVEMLDGIETRVYQYTTTVNLPRMTQNVNCKVWVGVADNLPRKVENSGDDGSKSTIVFTDYNADITIKPPM